jgi:hypothetical protein
LFCLQDQNIFHLWTPAAIFSLVAMPFMKILHLVLTMWNVFWSCMQIKKIFSLYQIIVWYFLNCMYLCVILWKNDSIYHYGFYPSKNLIILYEEIIILDLRLVLLRCYSCVWKKCTYRQLRSTSTIKAGNGPGWVSFTMRAILTITA